MSLREKVKEMVGEDELDPTEISNLILDELDIPTLSAEDKAFLEEFTNLEKLAMNKTSLTSTANFPDAPKLARIELNENGLNGKELKTFAKYKALKTLKFAGNNVEDFKDLECLKGLAELSNINLVDNPVSELDDYTKTMFKMFPNLEVLDGADKEGNEVLSEADDEEDDYGEEYGDEGEFIEEDGEMDPEAVK